MAAKTGKEEISDLEDELIELKLEIQRHHKDFQRIRDMLDDYDLEHHALVKEIRNIVG